MLLDIAAGRENLRLSILRGYVTTEIEYEEWSSIQLKWKEFSSQNMFLLRQNKKRRPQLEASVRMKYGDIYRNTEDR